MMTKGGLSPLAPSNKSIKHHLAIRHTKISAVSLRNFQSYYAAKQAKADKDLCPLFPMDTTLRV